MTEHFLKYFLINNNIRGSILLELVFMEALACHRHTCIYLVFLTKRLEWIEDYFAILEMNKRSAWKCLIFIFTFNI